MTIYTFGDPELLREVLLALATIFGASEWSDPGSPLGLGGNMLAVALIGLAAVVIAGVTTQQVRLDYLFVALVLFGIMFAAKVDVNVEDIQTGDAAVVADVPIGVAMVAAASSSAAASLTETVGTALQTPGRETSLLTDNGFLDPLRTLKSLQDASVENLDAYLYQSMMEYYRTCVGLTRELSPGTFNMDEFKEAEDPLIFMTDTSRILNYSTIYYSDANPDGLPMACYTAAVNLRARAEEIASGATPELEGYMRRKLGTKLYNTPFQLADIEDSVDYLFRGLLDGQTFMANLFVRNLYNQMEAVAQAEYGTNETQYVAQVTQAFEEKKVGSTTEGTVFLQYMFPIMSFMQFLFFALAPFIALVAIANPFAAGKTLGGYLLFGVWAYSWMPVAAIINHYMEISLQNNIELAGVAISGTGYTAIAGFDDFYNLLTSKLMIGSQALAATPVIVAAVLSAGLFGLTRLAPKMSAAGNADRVDTSMMAPRLAQNAAVVSAGGRFSAATGTSMIASGKAGAFSADKKAAYEQVQFRMIAQAGQAYAERRVDSASRAREQSIGEGIQALTQVATRSGVGSRFMENFTSSANTAISNSLRNSDSFNFQGSLGEQHLSGLKAELGIKTAAGSIVDMDNNTVVGNKTWGELKDFVKSKSTSIGASLIDEISKSEAKTIESNADLRDMAEQRRRTEEEYESALAYQKSVEKTAKSMYEIGNSIGPMDTTEIVALGNRRSKTKADLDAIVASAGPEKRRYWDTEARDNAQEKQTIGLFGRRSTYINDNEYMASMINVLAKEAASGDIEAMRTLQMVTRSFAGVGDPDRYMEVSDQYGQLGTVDEKMDVARRKGSDFESRSRENLSDEREALRGRANDIQRRAGIPSRGDVLERHRENVETTNDGAVKAANPNEWYKYEQAGQFYENFSKGRGMEGTAAGWLADTAAPKPGYPRSMEPQITALGEMDSSSELTNDYADALMAQVRGAMGGQFANADEVDVMESYQSYQSKGFSKKQAALAALGDVGLKRPGASDLMLAGAAAAITGNIATSGYEANQQKKWAEAGKKGAPKIGAGKLALVRAGGFVSGGALFAAGATGAYLWTERDAKASAERLGGIMKRDFKNSNPDGYRQYADELESAKTINDVTQVIEDYYREKNIASFSQPANPEKQGWMPISENDSTDQRNETK